MDNPGRRRKASSPWAVCSQPFGLKTGLFICEIPPIKVTLTRLVYRVVQHQCLSLIHLNHHFVGIRKDKRVLRSVEESLHFSDRMHWRGKQFLDNIVSEATC